MTPHLTSNAKNNSTMTACDLYPIVPDTISIKNALPLISEIASYNTVTALRLCINTTPEKDSLCDLTNLLYHHDIALILAPTTTDIIGSLPLDQIDGLHLNNAKELQKVSSSYLGQKTNLQIGCSCLTLDDAMHAGEKGADYVALPATETEALSQWSLIAQLPAVADNVTECDSAQKALLAGADFLGVPLQFNEKDTAFFSALTDLMR